MVATDWAESYKQVASSMGGSRTWQANWFPSNKLNMWHRKMNLRRFYHTCRLIPLLALLIKTSTFVHKFGAYTVLVKHADNKNRLRVLGCTKYYPVMSLDVSGGRRGTNQLSERESL